jgi:putative nucleotidyltransferase with HDIG domain
MEALDLYEKYGSTGYIGERVTQLQHACQTAMLAEKYCIEKNIPYTVKREVILGAFFHDIGHLLQFVPQLNLEKMGDLGILDHEIHGANYLKHLGYSDLTCKIIRNHINTKRYLISIDENYYNNLSDASKKTFEYQGGNMNEFELKEFESDKFFNLHLQVRKWDESAKSTDPTILNQTNYFFNKLKSFK